MNATRTPFLFVYALALATADAASAQAGNDVYNFYFQKGSAPQSVIQGGGGQQTSPPLVPPPEVPEIPEVPAAPPPSAATALPVPAPEKEPREIDPFELHLGATRFADEVGTATAYAFGGQYNFNRFIATRLTGHLLAVESADYKRPISSREQAGNRWGGQAALVVTPLHMELLGKKLLRVSAMAGFRSDRRFEDANPDGLSDVRMHVGGFVGASAGVTINDNLAVEGSVAMLDGGKIGQGTGSLVFSF